MPVRLVVGLRNPGSAYDGTRHNAGAWFVEALADGERAAFRTEKKFDAELAVITAGNAEVRLLLPRTFMNDSGLPVRKLADFYRIIPEEILVCHDELDLLPGRVKLKQGGGNGGHNGLKSIERHLGSAEFLRLRIGIGHPGHRQFVTGYVLGKPSAADRELITDAITRASLYTDTIFAGDIARAMNELNG